MNLRRASVCLLVLALLPRAPGAEQPPAVKLSTAPASGAASAASPAAPAVPLVPTVIESGTAEMVSTDKETTFTFRNGVIVTGTNLKMTCDNLEVIALRSGDASATLGKPENFKSLIATGNVRIVQSDREATCQRAEVLPGDNKVILTGNPKVRSVDGQYQATGEKMILHRGERRAEIVGEGPDRPRFVLPEIKDLGYEKEREKKKSPEPGPANPTTPASPPAETAPRPITVPIPAPKQ